MNIFTVVKFRSDLYGLKNLNIDQIVYCSKDNTFYNLIDISRSNKKDGWRQTTAIPSIAQPTSVISGIGIDKTEADLYYVKYQDAITHPEQIIYGDISVIGNIFASGEIAAFAGSAPSNWWNTMPIASATILGGIKVGANLTIDVNGILNASGGSGTSSWGAISGIISDQNDLYTALGLLAPKASPTFTGTVSGITGAMVGLGSVTNNAQWYSGNHPTTKAGYGITDVADLNHTHDILTMVNFSILQESGKIVIKYGTTIVGSISNAGYLKMSNEIESFTTP